MLSISALLVKKVGQRRNKAAIFNIEFYDIGQHRNNVANMTILKKVWASNKKTFYIKFLFKKQTVYYVTQGVLLLLSYKDFTI